MQLVVAKDGRDGFYVDCGSVPERISEKVMNITDIKHCCKCHCHKPRGDFADSTVAKDGKQPWCRQCMKAYRAARKASKEVA